MTSYRRNVLANVSVQSDTHAGLWLDKYLKGDDEEAKKILVKDITGIQTSAAYRQFFKRWKTTLIELCGAENCREAKTDGRLAVNLGAEGVLETSIALHHTYGVPYIPGSALKGLAAHYVTTYIKNDPLWAKNSEAFITLFGDTTRAGYITFFDALYVPGTGKGLVPDVITVHHPDYYQGSKPKYSQDIQLAPPADWDSPTPIPFISVNGNFLIALSGPPEWVKTAFEILKLALEREGVGAKTSSGYGRMKFENSSSNTEMILEKKSRIPQEVPAGYQRGIVKNFLEAKGYGFIQPEAGGKDVFVHVSNLASGLTELKERQHVIFKAGPGKQPGKLEALDVILDE